MKEDDEPTSPWTEIIRVDDPSKEPQRRQVDGVLDRIAEAEVEAAGLHSNHKVMFLGLICPIMAETDVQVQIQHGNTLMWVDKDKVTKVVGTLERRDPVRKWDSHYKNPLLKPHRP